MNLIDLAIKRPIFMTCLVGLMLIVGYLSLRRLPVDLFPDVTFPIATVTIPYPGAGPQEIETLVSKPVEDELSTLAGIKSLRSINKEGVSITVAEFTLETDVKYAEQLIRDRVGALRRKLPTDSKEPIIRRIDPADLPILILSVTANLPEAQLYDAADQIIKPKLEQSDNVGLVDILGGRKRELQVLLDRRKLKSYEVSATMVANRIAAAGQNIPAGKLDEGKKETVFRSLAEFKSVKDIGATIVNFAGNDVPVRVADLGRVIDTLEDESNRTYADQRKSIFLNLYRQSGANTIAVADGVLKRLEPINRDLARMPGHPTITLVRDGSQAIRDNVDDVKDSIYIGIALTLVVVFFFLGNVRSTLITGIAIPNSLLGAFLLMALAGFTVNIMSLLSLSLAVGLLIDDAIVVRENIFRHMELGEESVAAASNGAKEVQLAVIATTLTVIAVFGPIGFLNGVVGQFFKQFGLTICFVMAISLFDALTMAPMLSAYFAGGAAHTHGPVPLWKRPARFVLGLFEKMQDRLVDGYGHVLGFTLRHPLIILLGSLAVLILSGVAAKGVPKTFLPPQDNGEFSVSLELPPGASLDATQEVALTAQKILRANPELQSNTLTVGNADGEANVADFYVHLVPSSKRKVNTSQFKERLREQLKPLAWASPIVKDYDPIGNGQRPFNVVFIGDNLEQLETFTAKVFAKLKNDPALTDPELSYKPGKPEFQVVWDNARGERLGVSSALLGLELRTHLEGTVPAVFRENGREYDIRVRLQPDQRDLRSGFGETFVPNVNQSLVRLSSVAHAVETSGPSNITREDRGRSIQISADITPGGAGMGTVMQEIDSMLKEGELQLPPGIHYRYIGQAQDFKELLQNMVMAVGLAILFIYLVLASLYESFVTPFTIMLVLPLAMCGAFFALAATRQSLDIFSMIGCVMLLGIATKNSILLVDCTNQLLAKGKSRKDALMEAGRLRLRPILMTSVALIAGMLPVAIGLDEASKQRTSMGISIIGGLISSTLLSLIVVPAAFSYIDRFRLWAGAILGRLFFAKRGAKEEGPRNDREEEKGELGLT